MKRMVLVLLLASTALWGQSVSLSGPSSARPGDTVTLALGHTIASSSSPVGFQWNITAPQGWNPVTGLGTAATGAMKTLACFTDGKLCLVYGTNNATVIPPGQLATIAFSVPSGQAPGPVQIGLTGVVVANSMGNAISPAPTVSGVTVNILAREDLNGDGMVNVADLGVLVNQATGVSTCGAGDLNGDGKCDILDVIRLVLKILGL